VSDDTPAGQTGFAGLVLAPDSEWRGDVDPNELSETEEAYRAAAYEAVLHYTRDFGLSVFPLYWMAGPVACACRDGESCMNPGKHPCDLRWPEMATSDPEQAARWWRPPEPGVILPVDWRPWANIGFLTGERRFVTDIDTDAGKAGERSLAQLIEQGGGEPMPPTLTYQTGGGGRQYVLLVPEGIEVRSSASKIASGIDIKGLRSYGILPPSRSGKGPYLMLDDRSPDVPPTGWLDGWLREQHRHRTEHIRSLPAGDPRQIPADGLTRRAHAYISAALADATATVAAAPPRQRNQTLNDEAFSLFSKFGQAGFLSAADIEAALSGAAEACGLGATEIASTIASAWSGGRKEPKPGRQTGALARDAPMSWNAAAPGARPATAPRGAARPPAARACARRGRASSVTQALRIESRNHQPRGKPCSATSSARCAPSSPRNVNRS
jgi:hypothetical protein